MEILSNTQNNKATSINTTNTIYHRIQSLLNLKEYMDSILSENHYIAKSKYQNKLLDEAELIKTFTNLKDMGCLEVFCSDSKIHIEAIENILIQYDSFENLIELHNEEYIQNKMYEEKSYLDEILCDVDSQIVLDEYQRRVILTDEDYCLVIAGAGTGKTTTVAAKVKYLVEKKNILPSEILVVSLTNNAVDELKEKLNKILSINCKIYTFHSFGNYIINIQIPKDPEECKIKIDPTKLRSVVQTYFRETILKDESLAKNFIYFFDAYFEFPHEDKNIFNEIDDSCLTTMRSELNEFEEKIYEFEKKEKVSICGEVMRSNQEVKIANFLYLNSIEYEYEPIYPHCFPNSKKPYTPDFKIQQGDKVAYIEHFGITEDGNSHRFNKDELISYQNCINDKIEIHKKYDTTLIYTYSEYSDCRPLLEHLKEELLSNGFKLHKRSSQDITEKLISLYKNKYIEKIVNLVCRFINNFKANGFSIDIFDYMYNSTHNVRTKLFINICKSCYSEYENCLKNESLIDFEDIINQSAKIFRYANRNSFDLDYKYIIVDEYQDISRQRFDFIKALSNITNAKIIAVGDDWQSIYEYNGSDITLFTKFKESMGYAKELKLVNTYRAPQEVIDIAGGFIQKNSNQIPKELKSSKNIVKPVMIYTYNSNSNYAIAQTVESILEQIVEFSKQENKTENSPILLLGRFNNDSDKLTTSNLFELISENKNNKKIKSKKYPQLELTYMTAHASKGLGFNNVIVINGQNEAYGFPAKIEDDPVLSLVIKQDHSFDDAEERRLFYVAMTRTKNRVYFVAPEQNPSEFLIEIKQDYNENVDLHGNWNEDTSQNNI